MKYGIWFFFWVIAGSLIGEFVMRDLSNWAFVGGIIGFTSWPILAIFGDDDPMEDFKNTVPQDLLGEFAEVT